MKRIISIFLIATVIMSLLVVGIIPSSAATTSSSVTVTEAKMDKNGSVNVKWKALSNCQYYRIFYKIDNTGWVKAADVHFSAQGRYYPRQIMNKRITVPLYKIGSGIAAKPVGIYITVRGMNRNKQYNTSFKSYLSYANTLQAFAPRMYLQNLDSGKATFTVCDPLKINNSTKFRVFYRNGNSWKAIGDYNKNNLGNMFAIVTLNVPLYRVNNTARFTVRGVNNRGQYTTPFLNNAVIENSPNYSTYQLYRLAAG